MKVYNRWGTPSRDEFLIRQLSTRRSDHRRKGHRRVAGDVCSVQQGPRVQAFQTKIWSELEKTARYEAGRNSKCSTCQCCLGREDLTSVGVAPRENPTFPDGDPCWICVANPNGFFMCPDVAQARIFHLLQSTSARTCHTETTSKIEV